ncbi:MAG TPA: GNAT family N-acetyltransferase [Thermoanaerobaculia bacterium]|nr:GNAT family N-acetyltransferase [Thermoanaerobaculia bacterium]
MAIAEEPLTALSEYARVPIAFEAAGGRIKDYDAAGGGPAEWARTFDLSNWGLIAARSSGRLVGGAVIAFRTDGVTMLEGRSDLAVLWDIRVEPELRGKGIGAAIFQAVEEWAMARGCRQLKVETQDSNIAACRFYERRGCVLGESRPQAYRESPGEVQMLYYKDLQPGS